MSNETLYSTDEVAALLDLHVRTVRGYVRDGRLPAVRIGKQYRIAHADVVALTGGRLPPGSAPRTDPRVEVTSVVTVDGIDEPTSARIVTLVTGATASRRDEDVLHVQCSYDPDRRTARIVVIGRPDATATVVELVSSFVGSLA
ncbi:UNVERIFIED_CONTAM: hypothetical protein LK11_22760 [Mumia flava]